MSVLILLLNLVSNKVKNSVAYRHVYFFVCYLSVAVGSTAVFLIYMFVHIPCSWMKEAVLAWNIKSWQKFPIICKASAQIQCYCKASAQIQCYILSNSTSWSMSSPITLGMQGGEERRQQWHHLPHCFFACFMAVGENISWSSWRWKCKNLGQ